MSIWNCYYRLFAGPQFLPNASEATVKPIETDHRPNDITLLHRRISCTASVPAGRLAASLPNSPKSLLLPSVESLAMNRPKKGSHRPAGSDGTFQQSAS